MPQPAGGAGLNTPSHAALHNHSVNVKSFLAAGDGVTDDTAAFTSAATAAGYGGIVEVNPGTYILSDWVPPQPVHIRGAGMMVGGASAGTRLKAKTGATYVMQLIDHYATTVEDLTIDGNARAASGALVKGSVTTSQGVGWRNVEWVRCSLGLKLDASSLQADKNTLTTCRMDECDTGIWQTGANTQFTELRQVTIGATTGFRLGGGTLEWHGGGTTDRGVAGAVGIMIDDPNCYWLSLDSFIDEYGVAATSIKGNPNWPVQGVTVTNSILTGSTATVEMAANSSILYTKNVEFAAGNIKASGNDTLLVDDNSLFLLGSTYSPTGTNNRRHKITQNGMTIYGGVAGATPVFNVTNATGDILLAHAAGKLGFYGATTITKPTVSGSRGGNAALQSLLTQLAALGLIADSSS